MNHSFVKIGLTTLLFLIFLAYNVRAQTGDICGTPPMDSTTFVNKPWHGNNQYLLDLNDSIGYPAFTPKNSSADGFDTQTIYWIPVKAWVYNDDNGYGGITEVEVEESIHNLNRYFSGEKNITGHAHPHTRIQFYLKCNISYLNNSNYALDPSDSEVNAMWGDNHHTTAMNIHYIQSSDDFSGKGEFPGTNISFTCAVVTDFNAHLNSTLPHEIGHTLDIVHTHEPRCFLSNPGSNADCGNCRQEAVSRAKIQPVGCGNFSGDRKCELNGDAYCDTEADPDLSGLVQDNNSDGEFEYIGTGKDNWDDYWTPDIYNIMSYSQKSIREFFSPMQIATMYYWISGAVSDYLFPSQLDLHNTNEFVDIFEPDNYQHFYNTIEFSESQHRGLHAVKNGFASSPTFNFCDEDWVRFTLDGVSNQKIHVRTTAISGRPEVNTKLSLLNSDGSVELTSNDDKQPGDIYSEIFEYEISPGSYWIKVESVGDSRGEYELTIERCEEYCCYQELLGNNTEINGTTGSFNLGETILDWPEFVGNDLEISNLLYFNHHDNLGFDGDNSTFPIPNSHLQAFICNDSHLEVEAGGVITIGHNSFNKNATVTVLGGSAISVYDFGNIIIDEGSELIIDDGAELRLNGGTLRVQDGGKVTIKEGGLLIYEDGTTIELNGDDAELALGGLTHVGDNATFGFSYQGTESGYIRLLKEGHWNERFSAGTNAEVLINGEGKDDLVLYMEEDVDFWEYIGTVPDQPFSSSTFAFVEFRDGKVIMEDDARFNLVSRSRFYNMSVNRKDYQNIPRGLKIFDRCYITNSDFNYVDINAELYYLEKGALLGENSNFDHVQINVRGFGYNVKDCYFNSSRISSQMCTITNKVIRSIFEYGNATVSDGSTTELFIYGSEFRHTSPSPVDYVAAVGKSGGRLTSKCTKYTDNEIAIRIVEGAELNMSTLYGGGYNYFEDNDYNIQTWNSYSLLLEDGYNELYDGNIMNIQGSIEYTFGMTCPPSINVSNNIWTPYSSNQPPFPYDPNLPDFDEFELTMGEFVGGGGWQEYCNIGFHFGRVAAIATCGEHDVRDEDPPIGIDPKSDGDIAMPNVTSPYYFNDTPFDRAVKLASSNTIVADSANGNDITAADMYYELLMLAEMDTIANDSIANVVELMQWQCISNYKATIERMFTNEVLSIESNQTTFETPVQQYVDVLMNFTDSVKTPENYVRQFQLEMAKTSLFNTIGKKEKALQIVTNINYCEHDSLHTIILEKQIQNLAFDIQAQSMDLNLLLSDSITFQLDSTIFDIPMSSVVDSSGFGSYIISPGTILFSICNINPAQIGGLSDNNEDYFYNIYPVPATSLLYISKMSGSSDSDSKPLMEIFDLSGKLVLAENLNEYQTKFDISYLTPSLYIYTISIDNNPVQFGKISVVK